MDYSKFDDETLLQLIAQKNENALGELYDRFGRLTYSIALNSLGDPALAEEITQDVYLRVWNGAEGYRASLGKVTTWIVSITRNRSIDEVRRRNVRPEAHQVPWETQETDYPDRSMDIEEDIELSEQRVRIRNAVALLPEEQRRALALAYFQGYSHNEIAELLSEPLGTVKTRIRLAMKKLKQYLEQES